MKRNYCSKQEALRHAALHPWGSDDALPNRRLGLAAKYIFRLRKANTEMARMLKIQAAINLRLSQENVDMARELKAKADELEALSLAYVIG